MAASALRADGGFVLLDSQPRRTRWWALGLGVLAATGFQPFGLWPLALLAGGLFALIAARSGGWREAALLGWLFGMGHFTLGNSWIATAFTYQAEMPAVLGWLAVPVLSVYLAIYPALAAGAARALGRAGPGWAFALIFAGCWIVAEWLRSWVFTGYAWNPFAMVLLGPFERPGLALLAPFMGTYALSGLAMLLGWVLVALARARKWGLLAGGAALLVAGMYLPQPALRETDLALTVVQPDIAQDRVHEPAFYEDHFRRLASNSLPKTPGERRIVLWPESGMVDYLQEGYPQRYYDSTTAFGSPVLARRRLAGAIGRNALLMTGAVDLEIGEEDGLIRALGARNAVTVLDDKGDIVGSYAKAHLVPFGEYLPLRWLLEPLGLSRLVPGAIDFWPGPGPRTFDFGAYGKAAIQICYEIVFSGEVVEQGTRPDYIFNDSTDGWFGAFGPPQHFAQARMRAIEEGLPVLRSTTTGISGVIDAHGVVRQHLGMRVEGRIDGKVPAAAAPTLFSRFGNGLGLAWAGLALLAGLIALRRRAG
ncbi:apolipoprotein N-acyltransferase [Aurantiacibacter xanthus]|uniref:Apolipoprotein N-acyltransferase n=1 Tax=Aurantiacibacter xanthus TaxID=1784712 RepID=A0A3A1P6I0_9SPHN|nr:apolipoprotein N-acyltransferase [Aurantiacibacter xanthus]RIV88447.1 apolipoprotein N-acyltransferase [Aurantiacibacter xanthus]